LSFLRLLALGRRSLLRFALFALLAGLRRLAFALLLVGLTLFGIALLRVSFFRIILWLRVRRGLFVAVLLFVFLVAVF